MNKYVMNYLIIKSKGVFYGRNFKKDERKYK